MAVHASHAALPYPIKGARFSMLVPYINVDGDPTAPTTPDTEISKDNAAAADCGEEVSATSGMDGMALLTLTGAETDCSCLAVNAKAASGPRATLATLYPRVLPVLETGTATAGANGSITLPALATRLNPTGCIIKTTGGTGGGGTGGANNQARVVTGVSGNVLTVEPNWEVNPDNTTTYSLLLTETAALAMATNVTHWNGTAIPGVDTAGYPKVTIKDGLGQGEIATTGGAIDVVNVVMLLNSGAIQPAAMGSGTIVADTFAAGAINSTVAPNLDAAVSAAVAAAEGGSASFTVDNTEIVQARVVKLGTRADGVTVCYPKIRPRTGDGPLPYWIDTRDYLGGRWLYDAGNGVSSDEDAIEIVEDDAVQRIKVNQHYVVVWLDASWGSSGGDTAEITLDINPAPGQTIKALMEVDQPSDDA